MYIMYFIKAVSYLVECGISNKMDRSSLVSAVIFTVVWAGLLVISGLYTNPYLRGQKINMVTYSPAGRMGVSCGQDAAVTSYKTKKKKKKTNAASYTNEMALQRQIIYKKRSNHLTQVCKRWFGPNGDVSKTTLDHDILLHLDHQVCMLFQNIFKMILSYVLLFFQVGILPYRQNWYINLDAILF